MCSIFHSYIGHNPKGINTKGWLLSLVTITIHIQSISQLNSTLNFTCGDALENYIKY